MIPKRCICVAVLWGAAIGAAGQSENVSVLLERGIHQEETVGDLDAAIRIYRKIVEDARAARKHVAQATYRLGACQLRKGQSAKGAETLNALLRTYPDQKSVVAKARKLLSSARKRVSGPELAKIVRDAVTVISTCAEGDRRIAGQLTALKELDHGRVVKALVGYLDSDKSIIRRSAIYVLWRGGLSDITPAVPALLKLCSHEKELTRGMAALTLGGNKVAASYQPLCDMALKDASGYARRCAAYALGLLGRADAKAVLEKVAKDKDPFVRDNAQAALTMLGQPAASAPRVVRSAPANFADDVPADRKTISVTFDQRMRDGSWAWVRRYRDRYPETTGKPSYDKAFKTCSLPVKLEPGKVYWVQINTPPYVSFMSDSGVRAAPHVLLFATRSADGKPTPIPPELLSQAKAMIAAAGRPAPTVVRTTPATLANDVPAATDKIGVTFDQEMMDGRWSWVQFSKDSYPEMTGKPSYDKTRKTCSLPVKLQPGKVYWVGINSQQHTYFQTAAEKPARPYVILFATRGRDGKPTPIPEDLAAKARAVNAAGASAADEGRRASEDLATEGWKLWGQRKFPEAEVKFREAILEDAANADAWNGLGWAQQNAGKHRNAKHSFDKCLEIDPKHAGALNGLGWIAKIQNDTPAALGYWKKAVAALPTATAALNGLTTTYMEMHKYDEAIRYYEIWLKAEPANARVKAGLAKAKNAAKGR